jgi:hypothetical protein
MTNNYTHVVDKMHNLLLVFFGSAKKRATISTFKLSWLCKLFIVY